MFWGLFDGHCRGVCECLYVRRTSPAPLPKGEGKPKVVDDRETTVYKRALDVGYQLKMKASRCVSLVLHWGGLAAV